MYIYFRTKNLKMKTTEKILSLIYCLILIITYSSCSNIDDTDEYFEIPIDHSLINLNNWEMTDSILSKINNHRADLGHKLLQKDTMYATTYALQHTQYMISKNKLSHTNFFIRKELLLKKGATNVAENLAYGYTSGESVVNAWINSENHKKIIEGDYTHIGFGILNSNYNEKNYFTTIFYK